MDLVFLIPYTDVLTSVAHGLLSEMIAMGFTVLEIGVLSHWCPIQSSHCGHLASVL